MRRRRRNAARWSRGEMNSAVNATQNKNVITMML